MDIDRIIDDFKSGKLKNEEEEDFDFSEDGFDAYIKSITEPFFIRFKNILCLPLLLVHELLHLIFNFAFTRRRVEHIYITKPRLINFHAGVRFVPAYPKFYYQELLVSLSPMLFPIITVILGIIYPTLLVLTVYVLAGYRFSFPSKVDIFRSIIFPLKNKYFLNNDELNIIGSYLLNNFSLWEIFRLKISDISK